MSHSEVYKWFELYFPQYAGDNVETWFQNGKNSIRIRQKNHQEFIFLRSTTKEIGGLRLLRAS
jgi:hypothetical protein